MADNVKIAVIDDETNVRESFKMILEIKDYDCHLFEKATDFLGQFKKDEYDVIFLDLFLKSDPAPYNNAEKKDGGVLALQKIKEIDPEVEVCIVTGYATEKTHTNAISYGAMDYLQKPFIMEDIYELVTRALRKRREKKTIRKDQGPIGPIH